MNLNPASHGLKFKRVTSSTDVLVKAVRHDVVARVSRELITNDGSMALRMSTYFLVVMSPFLRGLASWT